MTLAADSPPAHQPLTVAIVGGGPSGMAAAHALLAPRWRGAFAPTIFERDGYLGGKCLTVHPDGRVCNGEPGGYELGAGVLSAGSPSNADLQSLIDELGLPTRSAAESGRWKYGFVLDGARRSPGSLLARAACHPVATLHALLAFRRYLAGLPARERLLHRRDPVAEDGVASFSSRTPRELQRAVCFGMQAFGYADRGDPGLTPPLFYYQQYATSAVIWNPVHVLPGGMQGIWAALGERLPEGSVRLATPVLRLERGEDGVVVHTDSGAESFDCAVIAVPLRPRLPFLDPRPVEAELLARVRHNHYVTVLARVRGLVDIATVFPDAATDPARWGDVVFAYQRYPDSDWTSLNLYEDPGQLRPDAELVAHAAHCLRRDAGATLLEPDSAWVQRWPDYFPHLGGEDLAAGWYRRFHDQVQGWGRTLWVSSGLHMETVGASVRHARAMVREQAPRWLSEASRS